LSYTTLFSQNTFFTIITLPDGTLMCGSENNGLFQINAQGEVLNHYVSSKNDESSLLSNSIWSLYLDDDNKIWLGYYNKGVAKYDKLYDKFNDIASYYNNPNSLQIGSVTSIAQKSNGDFLIGMDGGGIDIVNLQNNSFTHINISSKGEYTGLTSDYIQTIFIDSKENIWAGSWDKGIYFLKKGSKNFINFNTSNTNGDLASNTVMSITEDAGGTIWIAAYNGGVHSFDPGTRQFTHYGSHLFTESGVTDSEIGKVLVDNKDNIWLGTTKGLFQLERRKRDITRVVPMVDKMSGELKNNSAANHILSFFESKANSFCDGT